MKNDSSLVFTPSSIPSFATRGPDANLSSEGSEDVLKDPDDELTKKKRIPDSDEEESIDFETEFMGICLFPLFFAKFLPPFFFFCLHFIPICVIPLPRSPLLLCSYFP